MQKRNQRHFPCAAWWHLAVSQLLGPRIARRRAAACAAVVLALVLPAAAVRVISDEAGRAVSLPDHPHRIVCLAPSITDTIFALGAGADVAGITDFTRYPPEALRKPSVGGVLRPSLERIAVLHPDVAIGIAGFNDSESIRGIERMGVPVYLVNPSGLAGLYRSIDSIGRALGREPEAHGLVVWLRSRERRVRSQAASLKRTPAVFLALSLDPCITAGRGAFITELIEAAGARSVTDDVPREWVSLNIETVIPRQPDYILLFRDSPFGLQQMRARPGWQSLRAVQQGSVLAIDDRMQTPSPVAFDALEDFARQLRAAELHR